MNRILFIYLVFAAFFINESFQRCLPGEMSNHQYCYFRTKSAGLTYTEARDDCRARGAELAGSNSGTGEISNSRTLTNMIYMTLKRDGESYWIDDDSSLYYNCNVFHYIGQPISGDSTLGEATLYLNSNLITDENCFTRDSKRYGFCVYEEYGVDRGDGCGKHGILIGGVCLCDPYYIGNDCSIPTCNGYPGSEGCGGHGSCIEGEGTQDIPYCQCDEMWRGKKDCTVESNCYGYAIGSSLACSGHGDCVGQDECICHEGYEQYYDCRVNASTFDETLHPDLCSTARLGIKPPYTGETWFYNNKSCWTYEGGQGNLENVIQKCRNRHKSAHVMSIHSDEELSFVRGKINANTWNGLTDIMFEDKWINMDGTPYDYDSWDSDYREPNNYYSDWWGGEQLCVQYTNGVWHDYSNGNFNFGMMCRIHLDLETALPVESPWDRVNWEADVIGVPGEKVSCDLTTGECPELFSTCYGFRYDYEEVCGGRGTCTSFDKCECGEYEGFACADIDCSEANLGVPGFVEDGIANCWTFKTSETDLSWFEAENACKEIHPNAHLASIHSYYEANFIFENSDGMGFWIGGHDLIEEGAFQWTDGTDFDFEVFMNFEPDNLYGTQNYLRMDSWRGDWSDEEKTGNEHTAYACKIRMFYKDKQPKTSPWDNVIFYDLDVDTDMPEALYCNLTIGPLKEHPCPNFMFYCHDKLFADEDVCGGPEQGICESWNLCKCINGYYGVECENYECNGYFYNDTRGCNGNPCIAPDTCDCQEFGITGQFCNKIMTCGGVAFNDTNATNICNGKGACVGQDLCECTEFGWYGENCDKIMKCNGTNFNEKDSVCNGRGNCYEEDKCNCTTFGFSGDFCETKLQCNGTDYDSEKVCNGKGTCLETGICECSDWRFVGDFCQIKSQCGGFDFDDKEKVCNNRGNCTSNFICICSEGWEGTYCEDKSYIPPDDTDDDADDKPFQIFEAWMYPVFGAAALLVLLLLLAAVIVGIVFIVQAILNSRGPVKETEDFELDDENY